MKNYLKPEIKVYTLQATDAITVSICDNAADYDNLPGFDAGDLFG